MNSKTSINQCFSKNVTPELHFISLNFLVKEKHLQFKWLGIPITPKLESQQVAVKAKVPFCRLCS